MDGMGLKWSLFWGHVNFQGGNFFHGQSGYSVVKKDVRLWVIKKKHVWRGDNILYSLKANMTPEKKPQEKEILIGINLKVHVSFRGCIQRLQSMSSKISKV